MKIIVNIANSGKNFTLEVDTTAKVVDVKKNIQQVEGIAINQQQLTLNDKQLEDDVSIGEYNIQEDAIIQLTEILPEQAQLRSCDSGLIINEKGNFKWFGEFAGLCDFLERLELQTARWSTPGGGSKQLENEDVAIRWYCNNGTVTVKGKKAEEVKAKLLSIIENGKDNKSTLMGERSKYDTIHIKPPTNNLHIDLTNNDSINLHTESHNIVSHLNSTIAQKSAQRSTVKDNYDSETNKLKHDLERFAENVTNRLETLTEEVINIKENKVYSIIVLEDVVKELKNERADLIKENTAVRETNEILSHDMSDLKSKMQELKSEKQSLLTALRLLQGEHMQTDKNKDKRIQDLEIEKESLLTALGVLQQDMVNSEQNKWTTVKKKQNKVAPKKSTKSSTINTSNQYSILTDSDTEDGDISVKQRPTTSLTTKRDNITQKKRHGEGASTSKEASHESPRVKATPSNSANISSPHQPPCQQNSDSILQEEDVEISEINVDTVAKGSLKGRQPIGDNSSSGKSAAGTKSGRNKKTKSNTVIVGDSMIKYVKGWEISSATNRVTVKSFSGASVEDMTDFIKPILRKKPEKIVLHIGTNNLRNDDAKSVADGITNLAHSIQQQCPDIEIIVSGVITRSDDMSASSRVRETNKLVKSMCDQNDWNFIPNSNIKNTHLNVRGLHLNPSGSLLLQNNFKLAITK
jgi:hypothetical protein